MVIDTIDDLFQRDIQQGEFAAAPDIFPPDKFNAGVLVVCPDETVFQQIVMDSKTIESYDGGDTGLLNTLYPNWYEKSSTYRLPFGYNAQRTMHWFTFVNQPNYWKSIPHLKIIHYSSSPKPWQTKEPKGDLEWQWQKEYMESNQLQFTM